MSISSKGFEEAEDRLEELYAKCDCLMADNADSSLIKATISLINNVFADMERLAISESSDDSKQLLQIRLKKHYEFRCKFDGRIANYFQGKLTEKEVASALSVPHTLRSRASKTTSKRSSLSTSSSMAAAKLVAKEEVAKLKLKQLEEKRELERKQQRQRRRAEEESRREEEERRHAEQEREQEEQFNLELLKARHEIEEASLERQVIEEEIERGGYIPSESETKPLKPDIPTSSRRLLAKETQFVSSLREAPTFNHERSEIHPTLEQAAGKVSYRPNVPVYVDPTFPKIELGKFNGNPMHYIRFIKTFEANVEARVTDPNKRLLLLIQHCEGEAKKVIDYCLLLEPHEGYSHAKTLLKDNFGRRNQIARVFMDKLHSDSIIKRDDKKGLVNLARDLEECELTFRQLNLHSRIDNFDAIGKIVQRLPYDLQNRWIRKASKIECTGEEPTISDLIQFVKEEAEVVKSIYSKLVYQKSKRVSSFLTNSIEVATGNLTCYLCSRDHLLKNCFAFRKKSLKDKYEFIKQKRLCFNCFKQGHIAKFCSQDKACTVEGCRGKHHELIHRSFVCDEGETNQPSTSNSSSVDRTVGMITAGCTTETSYRTFLNVVPVKVRAGNKTVNTYAFLDQGSTATLCESRLLQRLGISGEKAKYSLTTVNQTEVNLNGKKATFLVSALNGDQYTELTEVFCVEKLPISPNPCLTEKELNIWTHLRGIEIPKLSHPDVQLLIGIDNPELFWTQEERYGKRREPFAIKTFLGWSIIGGSSYSNKTLNINFVSRADQLLQKQVECLWKLDMVPNSDSKPGMSRNDRYALDLLNNSKKQVNGHYQVKLLWKPGCPKFNSNFKQAIFRLESLRQRFARDENFQTLYTETMQGYVDKGFAERVSEHDLDDNNCWYLPHHAVSHPRKANKVRVVFDCAARYNGTSLNEQLLTGPDLLNNLFGVLTRFRKGKVTLVADIESMYHQVLVDPQDRKYLKFLWWPSGNTNLPPARYRMKVHVFGAASSPACATYALQQTAKDNDLLSSQDVIDTVLENFYMDDCLKSVDSVEEAIRMSDELAQLLKKGGFNLTKWLSNNDRVVSNFVLEKRAKIYLDLREAKNILHQVLGVTLNFEEDSFQIDINLKDKPLTRRGVLSQVSAVFDPLGFAAPVILKAELILQELCRLELGWDEPIPEQIAIR